MSDFIGELSNNLFENNEIKQNYGKKNDNV